MRAKHASPSLRPRRTALIAAISALAIFGGIQGANALQGDGGSAPAAVYAEPTPAATEAPGDPEALHEPEYNPSESDASAAKPGAGPASAPAGAAAAAAQAAAPVTTPSAT
ncbi:hypothetical protein [Streptodolium elevatio]